AKLLRLCRGPKRRGVRAIGRGRDPECGRLRRGQAAGRKLVRSLQQQVKSRPAGSRRLRRRPSPRKGRSTHSRDSASRDRWGSPLMEWLFLALAVFLIFGTGVFVAAEFSLLTLDRHTADQAVAAGVVASTTLRRSMTPLSTHLSAAQVGITITTLLTGYLMDPSLGKLLAPVFEAWGVGPGLAAPLAMTIALIVSTVGSMIFVELVPKNLAIAVPLATGRIAAPVQYVCSIVLKPVIAARNVRANKILAVEGVHPPAEGSGGRRAAELTSLVGHRAEGGVLDEQTGDLRGRTLSFSGGTAEDLMAPRTGMSAVGKDPPARQIIQEA